MFSRTHFSLQVSAFSRHGFSFSDTEFRRAAVSILGNARCDSAHRRGKMVWLKNQRATIEEGNGWRSEKPAVSEGRAGNFALRPCCRIRCVGHPWPRFFWTRYHFRGVEYPLFLFAIAVTVWYAGVGPAILAVVLSSLFVQLFLHRAPLQFLCQRVPISRIT